MYQPLSTQIIKQQLQELPCNLNLNSALSEKPSQNAQEDIQVKLDRMASQPSNFGYGIGVALNKTYTSMSKFCDKLSSHFLNKHINTALSNLFWSNSLVSHTLSDSISSSGESGLVDECRELASEVKKQIP